MAMARGTCPIPRTVRIAKSLLINHSQVGAVEVHALARSLPQRRVAFLGIRDCDIMGVRCQEYDESFAGKISRDDHVRFRTAPVLEKD